MSKAECWSGMKVKFEVRAEEEKKEAGIGQKKREGVWGQLCEVCCPPKVVPKAGAPGEEEGKEIEGDD